jgi:hypothetical protein
VSVHRKSAGSILPALARAARRPVLPLLLCAALAGCRQKIAPYTIPLAAQAPVALEQPPTNQPPPVITTEPSPDFGPLPPVNPPPPAPRRHSGPKEEPAPPAPTEAPVPPPPDLSIGSLSTGTGSTPQVQQQAQDMISSILKSVTALPAKTADAQKHQIRQVRHFLDQAQQALNTGDTEGAKNLATKARLLMDDLEKK